tara:strand:- start:3452 stop:4228 length:777 start_codon:yes stop_codon:yes gene_type:complete
MESKNIALRSKSMRSGDRPYTTPGLGDRAHSVLMAYQYSRAHKVPVTLHLTSDKYGKPHKKVSWKELTEMVTGVDIKVWDVCNLPEKDWLKYLKDKGYDAEIYYYEDTFGMHPNEEKVPLEISQYLRDLPELKPAIPNMWLPIDGNKFVTMQWDSTDISRSMTPIQIEGVIRSYEDLGYEIVTVGGKAKVPDLKNSLKHIGFAMYHAKYHVGVDSGMMHIAQFYKKYEDIHIHNYGFTSHHLVRAKQNGTKINYVPKD